MSDLKVRLGALAEEVSRDPGSARFPELAETLISLGRYPEAVQVCEQGLARSALPRGRTALAEALLLQGQPELALDAAERAVLEQPDEARGLRVLAECHLGLDRPDLAAPLLERSARLDPSDMRTLDLLAARPPPPPQPAAAVETEAPEPGQQPWSFDDDLLEDPEPAASSPAPGPPSAFEAAPGDDPFEALTLEPLEAAAPSPARPDSPPADGAPAPAATVVAGPPLLEDAPLELDTGRIERPAPPAPEPRAPAPPPERRAPTPSPSPGLPAAPLLQSLVAHRRALVLAGGGVLLLAAIIGGGIGLRGHLRDKQVDGLLGEARGALVDHTFGGYREADRLLAAALELAPEDGRVLGLGAFVATRLFVDFEGGTETLVRAEERLSRVERLEAVPDEAVAARSLLDLAQGRPGDVVVRIPVERAAQSPVLRWVRALVEHRLERTDLAAASLEESRRAQPDFLPAAASLGEMLRADGRAREATEVYTAVLDAHPRFVPALIGLVENAEAGHASGEDALVRVAAARAELLAHASPTELCRLNLAAARLAVRLGRPADAHLAEETARTVLAGATCKADLAHHLLRRHRLSEAADQFAGAADALEATDADQAVKLRLEAARAAVASGRTSRALELLGQVPPDGVSAAVRARAHLLDRNVEAARAALAPQLRGGRRSAVVQAAAAEVALAEGREVEARKHARAAAGAAKGLRSRVEAARALLSVGEAREAARQLRRVVRPQTGRSYAQLTLTGSTLSSIGATGEGLGLLEEAIRLNPDAEGALDAYLAFASPQKARAFLADLPQPYGPALEAEAALFEGDVERSRAALERAKEAGAKGPRVALLSAQLALEGGGAAAVALLKETATANGDRTAAHLALGEGLLRLGRVGDAADAYEEALRRDPSLLRAAVGLSEARAAGAAADPSVALRQTRQTVAWLGRRGVGGVLAARAHAAVAAACISAGDRACTQRGLAAARRLGPDHPNVILASGRALEEAGQFRAAAGRYREAATRPGGEEGLLLFGLLAAEDRIPREGAADALQRFLQRLPGHARAPAARQALATVK